MPATGHGGHDTVELVAALILAVGGALFVFRSFATRPGRMAPAASPVDPALPGPAPAELPSIRRSLAMILAGLSAGAAVIHLSAAPGHYEELGDLGAGFVAAGAFQAGWIRWCLAGPSRRTALVGIAGNLAIVSAWIVTRTVGLPPFVRGPEPIGYPDAASVLFEVLLVAGLVGLIVGSRLPASRRRILREVAAIAVVPLVGLIVVMASLATVAIADGLDHGGSGGPDRGHVAAP